MKPAPPVLYHRLVIERDGAPPAPAVIAGHLTAIFGILAGDDYRFASLEVTSRNGPARAVQAAEELVEEIEAEARRSRPPVPDLPIRVQVATRPPPDDGAIFDIRIRNHPGAALPGLELDLKLAAGEVDMDARTLLFAFQELGSRFAMTRGFVASADQPALRRGPYSRRLLGWLTLASPQETLPGLPGTARVLALEHGASVVQATPHLPTGSAADSEALSALVAAIGPALSEPPEPAKSPPKLRPQDDLPRATPAPVVAPIPAAPAPVVPPASVVPPAPLAPLARAPTVPAAGPRPRAQTDPGPLSGTLDIEAAMAQMRAASPLPFAERPRTPGAAVPPAAIPARREAPTGRPASFTGTLDVSAAMAAARAISPLPFPAGDAGPALPREAAPEPGPDVDLSAAARAAETLSAPLTQPPSGHSLEQYASLCAEMALYPEHAREIARRYRITDEAAWHALHDAWRAWLARDHAQWQRFRELEKQYTAWLTRHGKPP